MRLQRYLSLAGVASRRHAETMIVRGFVRVNGRVVKELGTKVADGDRVDVQGRPVDISAPREVVVLNKPVGVMTTMHDPEGRPTVAGILRTHRASSAARLVPVGRLDYDTSGLLLLTNDGDLAHALTHPRFGVDKLYRATLRGRLTSEEVTRLRAGMKLDDGRTAPAQLRVVAASRDRSVIDITLHEGRNRQVRRMFEGVGHPLLGLERLRFGPISLGGMRSGDLREVTDKERRALDAIANQTVEEQETNA